MKLKQLDKSIKLYQELKYLDAKIIALDKFANMVVNGATDLGVSLSLTPKKEEKKAAVLNDDGSLSSKKCTISFSNMVWGMNYGEDTKPTITNIISINETIDEKVMYMFLDFTLKAYHKRREFLISKIEKI